MRSYFKDAKVKAEKNVTWGLKSNSRQRVVSDETASLKDASHRPWVRRSQAESRRCWLRDLLDARTLEKVNPSRVLTLA